MCAAEDLLHKEIALNDVARTLAPVLVEADATPLEWCEPLEQILEKTKHCQSLRDLMEDGFIEQGRMLKDAAGAMFYDPAALVAFCRFNFLLRRAFIRMLHADLSAVREARRLARSQGSENGGLPPGRISPPRKPRRSFDTSAKTGGSRSRRTTRKTRCATRSSSSWHCAPIWKKRSGASNPARNQPPNLHAKIRPWQHPKTTCWR